MNSSDFKNVTTVTAILTIIFWMSLNYFLHTEFYTLASVKNVFTSITLTGFFWFIYLKWLWKVPGIRSILYKPNLNGTWLGQFKSDWKNDNGEEIPPGSFVLVIRQTDFLTLSIMGFSANMNSLSTMESLQIDDSRGPKKLGYIFDQKRSASSKYSAKQGAALLNLSQSGKFMYLSGDFWTLAKTSGYIEVKHTGTRIFIDKFEEANNKWPNAKHWAKLANK